MKGTVILLNNADLMKRKITKEMSAEASYIKSILNEAIEAVNKLLSRIEEEEEGAYNQKAKA